MIGIIVLAAGASTRLGEPKQKVQFQGKSLLQHAVQVALNSDGKPVVVVLGANAEAVRPEVAQEPVQLIINPEWQEGMSASIRTGLSALQKMHAGVTGVILMLCDQPFVEPAILNKLIEANYATGKGIIACAYNKTLGAPVFFDKAFFPDLLSLKGQEGAKKLLFKHANAVASIPFPQGSIDIDTPADYALLHQGHNNNNNNNNNNKA
ncbi:NTP transferase domain-containing protein [Pontibacter silvestris]|uniref:NTP transferase domain-containing protein n=1 Tax=Pontibacter silvestris TaxID=2305183 RepID=A0ABW4WU52_9BACT|nr:nucleotidyltransferase family protein [Pontibacter silvestris]MCC9136951.1 nucleotidyltransferase family protein [Pontibacter silvestris]